MSAERLSDANLIESFRAFSRYQEPAVLEERDGLLLLAGATTLPAACINVCARTEPRAEPVAVLAAARDFYRRHGRGFKLAIRSELDGDLEQHVLAEGLKLDFDSPCMSVEKKLEVPALPVGVYIERLESARHADDIATVSAQAYEALGMPVEHTRASFSRPAGLLDGRTLGVLVYREGEPVATALALLGPKLDGALAAGIYWVGTVPSARKQGLAEFCTALATNAALEHGAKVVTLQASPYGEPIYRRMGYREYGRVRWYRHRAPAVA